MGVGTGIGLVAFLIAGAGVLTPVLGLFMGWFALGVACVAALFGDKGFTVATVLVSVIGFVFLTPTLWFSAANTDQPEGQTVVVVTVVMVLAPLVCIFLRSTGRLVLGASPTQPTQP